MKQHHALAYALGVGLAVCSAVSMPLAQESEPPPPPEPQLLEDTEVNAALEQVAQYLSQRNVSNIISIIVADDQDNITSFRIEAMRADKPFKVDHLFVPVDLGNGRGGITADFVAFHYMYQHNPVVSGSCGPNHGGSSNCN